uniref:Uncharacterized protein n=1 Tax=Arundo donax TaxID=35708 RepID=A0A0A8XRK9_ARUDO
MVSQRVSLILIHCHSYYYILTEFLQKFLGLQYEGRHG